MFSASNNGEINYWNKDGQLIQSLQEYNGSVALTTNGKILVCVLNNGNIGICDIQNAQIIRELESNTFFVYSVIISPDNTLIAANGYDDNIIKIWNLITGESKTTLQVNDDATNSFAMTLNNDKIIISSDDGVLYVWDIFSKSLLLTLNGHTQYVWSIIVTPNGQEIISASSDGTIRVWDIIFGLNTNIINVESDVWDLAITSSGDKIICGCEDNNVYIYILFHLVTWKI